MSLATIGSSVRRPISRLMAKSVFSELVTAWRLAAWPTRRSSSVKATIEGVVRAPSEFSITRACLPSMMATQELVVPRSIPMTFDMHDFLSSGDFTRRVRLRPPPVSLGRILTAPCGSGIGRLYRIRVFCLQAVRRDARGLFWTGRARMIAVNGFEIHKGWLDPGRPGGDGGRAARRRRGRAVLRAADPLGQADERADDLRRPLRLVHRRARLPLHRPPPERRAVAADPGLGARGLARARLERSRPRLLPGQLLRRRPRAWACTATPTRRTSPGRSSRSASAIRRSSGWAARRARIPPPRSCSKAATWCSWPARRGSPTTASTASASAARRLLPQGGRINLTLRVVD